MGFAIHLDDSAADMVDRLARSPYDVFGTPYPGYLLFLFEDVDRGVWSWFREHARSLDTLTGQDIAFAVFSHRFTFDIRTSERPNRAPRRLGEVSVEKLRTGRPVGPSVERLLKSGLYGSVVTGDELAAVNEAVHQVAREMGVTQHLPCVVVLDGLPEPSSPCMWLPLSPAELPGLYGRLRIAVGELQTHPNAAEYREGLLEMARAARAAARWRDGIREIETSADVEKPRPSALGDRLAECRRVLEMGRKRLFLRMVEGLSVEYRNLDWGPAEGPIDWDTLLTSVTTRHTLRKCLAKLWPLSQEDVGNLTCVHAKYVCAHLPDAPAEPPVSSREQVEAITGMLDEKIGARVDGIMARPPTAARWEKLQEAERLEFRRRQEARLSGLRNRLHSEESRLVQAARRILDMPDRPSLCRLLGEKSGRDRQCGPLPEGPVKGKPSGWMDWLPLSGLLTWLSERRFWTVPRLPGPQARERAPTASASYASVDRAEVVRRVQGMRAWHPGLDVFLDFHSLYPGELWRERVEEEIRRRDRFLLFWSRAARGSEYVEGEWRKALELRGLSFIQPVPLEPPEVAPPPPELSDLHFNDAFLDSIRYEPTAQEADGVGG
jgi:hypothetical protein